MSIVPYGAAMGHWLRDGPRAAGEVREIPHSPPDPRHPQHHGQHSGWHSPALHSAFTNSLGSGIILPAFTNSLASGSYCVGIHQQLGLRQSFCLHPPGPKPARVPERGVVKVAAEVDKIPHAHLRTAPL